jgi:hypothetical protein
MRANSFEVASEKGMRTTVRSGVRYSREIALETTPDPPKLLIVYLAVLRLRLFRAVLTRIERSRQPGACSTTILSRIPSNSKTVLHSHSARKAE